MVFVFLDDLEAACRRAVALAAGGYRCASDLPPSFVEDRRLRTEIDYNRRLA